jgi:hypothetical protein
MSVAGQALAGPVGSVEVTIWANDPAPTHSVVVGHERSRSWIGTVRDVHAAAPPVGFVAVHTSP